MPFQVPVGGFVDGHCHPLFAAREMRGAIAHNCQNTDDLAAAISHFRGENPALTWLDLSAIVPGEDLANSLDRYELDAIVSDIPLVLHTTDHHSIVVNSKALQVSGFDKAAPQVSGGEFEVDPSGKPTGWIHEYIAMQLIYSNQPKPSLEDDVDSLLLAQNQLIEHGISGLLEAWIDPEMPEVYLEAERRGLLRLVVNLAIRVKPESWQEDLEFAKKTRSLVTSQRANKVTCRTVKIFLDGVHSSGTAHILSNPATHGVWKFEELRKMASEANLTGFQLHFHACGDAAVRTAIELVERLHANQRKLALQPVIAHAEQIEPSDISRLAKLGIGVNMQPAWLDNEKPDWHPIRALLDAGVSVSFGSDWPVSSPDPQAALEHLQAMGKTNPHWRLSEDEFLACYGENSRLHTFGGEYANSQTGEFV